MHDHESLKRNFTVNISVTIHMIDVKLVNHSYCKEKPQRRYGDEIPLIAYMTRWKMRKQSYSSHF